MNDQDKKLISDNPSTSQVKAAMPAIKLASVVAGALAFLGNEKAKKFKTTADDLLAQTKIIDVPDRFNEAFAKQGWIATGSLSMEVMQTALDHHDAQRHEDAENAIIEWFNEDNITLFCIQRSRRYHKAQLRDEQLNEALKLSVEERYIAAIPLILIACDGLASDVAGGSPFKSGADLSCFDSIVGHESALPTLIGRITTGIRKSSDDFLELPNRHGILHGRSLGYANRALCAKSWMLYLSLVDWASDKASENERRTTYEEEQASTFGDSLKLYAKVRKDREISETFQTQEWMPPFAEIADVESPVASFHEFFLGWQKRNFGRMAQNAMNPGGDSIKKLAGEMRNMADLVELLEFELVAVKQTTVARAEALVNVKARTSRNEVSGQLEALAFRYTPEGDIAMPQDSGHWCVQQNCVYRVMNEKFVEPTKPNHSDATDK